LVLYRSGLARSLKTFPYQYFFQSNLNSILDQVLHQEFSRSIDQNWSGLTIINDIFKVFSINALFVLWNKLFHIYLSLEKLVNKKLFLVKEKFSLVFIKVFFFILDVIYFPEIIKNLKISCYLLIISNLVINLLIIIYFVLNLYLFILFLILSFRIWFNFFYINLGPHSFNYYSFFFLSFS
jgi:hypothetical protein